VIVQTMRVLVEAAKVLIEDKLIWSRVIFHEIERKQKSFTKRSKSELLCS
jgi:hypothetical protein